MTDKPTAAASMPTPPPAKGRSPNYPGVSLSKAIDRAREIYDKAKHHPVPIATIAVDYWRYKSPTTGPASVTYAALKRYGLLADEGSGADRVARLTDLAVEILVPNPNQEAAVQRAALIPSINREWWDTYGTDLPPPDTLHWQHVVKGPFTENGLEDFLRVYRDTVAYAKLSKSDNLRGQESALLDGGADSDEEGGGADGETTVREDGSRTPPPPKGLGERKGGTKPGEAGTMMYTYPIRMPKGGTITVEGEFPVSDSDWDTFLNVLKALRPTLTQPDGEVGSDQGDVEDE